MSRSASTHSRKSPDIQDLSIVGDFIKYLLIFFIPFLLLGVIYGFINQCYFMCMLVNPLIYAGGISSIIIVIQHDVDEISALFGRGKRLQLAQHIKHADAIQKISFQMGLRDYGGALKTVNKLLGEEPKYSSALNLKGQILLEGFKETRKARLCFEKVLKQAKPGSEDYKLAKALKATSYKA